MSMREIKFRGKSIDNGEWVYGSYTSMSENNRNNPICQVESKIFHRIWQWEAGDWNMGGYANYEVIPETIGQFTGLKDKNGVEIYEGDILNREKEIILVLWDNKYACFTLHCDNWSCLSFFYEDLDVDEVEVIGNIHDNPEQFNIE